MGGGSEPYYKIRNWLLNRSLQSQRFETKNYSPYVLFLNGEYWGNYFINERYDKEYFKKKYSVNTKNIVLLKGNVKSPVVEIGDNNDISLYNSMYEYITNHDMSEDDCYFKAMDMIDIDSCIDYYASEIYFGNIDWPHNNYAIWRTKEKEPHYRADTKWRWILYDTDSNTVINKDYWDYDFIEWAKKYDPIFESLMNSEDFQKRVYKKMIDLAEEVFYPDAMESYIDEFILMMQVPMEKEYKKYYGDKVTIQDFLKECDSIKEFFRLRYEYITNRYGG